MRLTLHECRPKSVALNLSEATAANSSGRYPCWERVKNLSLASARQDSGSSRVYPVISSLATRMSNYPIPTPFIPLLVDLGRVEDPTDQRAADLMSPLARYEPRLLPHRDSWEACMSRLTLADQEALIRGLTLAEEDLGCAVALFPVSSGRTACLFVTRPGSALMPLRNGYG